MKLHSAEDLLLRCKRFVNDDVLEMPIRVLVPDQTMPVYFLLKARGLGLGLGLTLGVGVGVGVGLG